VGVATRVNGAAPPFVPLEEIDLASWDFWAHDDDFRDGAFATPRREALIAFHQELTQEGWCPARGTGR
jgi:methyl-branched lipid omega-hydroxylase